MRRSVVITGIVVAAMAVAPASAFADARPVAAVDDTPSDCRPAGTGPQDGSGTGDATTGGDGSGAAGDQPGDASQVGTGEPGTSSDGRKPTDEKPGAGGSGAADDRAGSGGTESAGDDPPGDGGGRPGTGQGSPGEDQPASGGDRPEEKQGDQSSGQGSDDPDGGQGSDDPDGEKPDGTGTTADEPDGRKPAATDPAACPTAAGAGEGTTAAKVHDWGTPNRVDDFDGDLSNWSIYDGPGHAGNGRRSPEAASVKDGILTIDGNADGTTAGMAWNPGQKYGRWEGRVRAPASDESYNALLLLWPDAENFPVGGEVDFMEMMDHTRQETNLFLHHGAGNDQVQGKVQVDATQWHNWAVEWTPEKVTAYLDGKEWWSTTDTSILPPGPMHLCIQLDWFPGSGGGDVTPSKMEVDWVRQYSLPESGNGDEKGDSGGSADDQGDKKGAEGLLDGVGNTLDRLVRRTEGAPDPVTSTP